MQKNAQFVDPQIQTDFFNHLQKGSFSGIWMVSDYSPNHSYRRVYMSLLAKFSPLKSLRRAFTRVINIESVPTFDKYDHMSNMKTRDLFQYEPFNESNTIVWKCLLF